MYVFFVTLLKPYLLLMLALGLGLLVLWLRASSGRRTITIVGLIYAILWIISTPLAAHYGARWFESPFPPLQQRPAEAQAIVVLGCGTISPGEPDQRTQLPERGFRRVLRAAELYHDGRRCPIVVAGGRVDTSKPGDSEAAAMLHYLLQLDVAESDILLEDGSRDTRENASRTRELLGKQNINTIVLVTDAIHMGRAVDRFQEEGFEVIPAPSHYRMSEYQWDAFALLPDLGSAKINQEVFHELLGHIWNAVATE